MTKPMSPLMDSGRAKWAVSLGGHALPSFGQSASVGCLRRLVRCGVALTLTVVVNITGLAGESFSRMAQAKVIPEPMTAEERDGLAHALAMTPYALVVVHTRITVEPIPSGRPLPKLRRRGEIPVATQERHIYEARVMETLRGPTMKRVRYEVVVDSGDSFDVSTSPAIVMLCQGPRGLYWGGVGAYFEASHESVTLARKLAKDIASKPVAKFEYCH